MSETIPATEGARKRPSLAAVLALIIPGLGHVYIRMWGRALLWFALYFLATQLFLPEAAVPQGFSVEAFAAATAAVPLHVAFLILSVAALNVVDAYLMTRRRNRRATGRTADGTATCPTCGNELDADLDFCHWCTTEFDADGTAIE